jgi:hypothetical protein
MVGLTRDDDGPMPTREREKDRYEGKSKGGRTTLFRGMTEIRYRRPHPYHFLLLTV